MPHQGIVTITVAALSLAITLGLLIYVLGREKRTQAGNTDEH